MRSEFPGILPDADGQGHESQSAGARGLKKLDVNYSTNRSGLELAISIKTMNFTDGTSKRFTKNTKRVDGELRAEAQDCHSRQPYAVLAGFFFVPWASADDGTRSSLKHNVNVFAQRGGRTDKTSDHSLFEFMFIGLYRDDGYVRFFPATHDAPERGVPDTLMTFSETLSQIKKLHGERNRRR